MLTKKKLASLAMAGVMTLSLAAPAFAASSESTTNRSLKVTGAYQAVTINVVVPSTGSLIINPYALPVEIGKDSNDQKVTVSEQLVTKPLAVKSQADINLKMKVATTVALTGSMKLATSATSGSESVPTAFITLDIEKTKLTGDKDTVNDAAIASAYAEMYDDSKDVHWGLSGNGWTQVLASGTKSAEDTITLTKATMDTDTGAFASYAEGSIAFIGFTGDCTTEPKTAWTTKDGATITLAFTFTPDTTAAADGNP
jgi:hypothetical protein